MKLNNSPFLYPNVSSVPAGGDRSNPTRPGSAAETGEFGRVFDQTLNPDLSQVKAPLKFSAHATQRLADRKIQFAPETMAKISEAVDRADAKGVEESLVLTPEAALIVSVKNRTVITALDRTAMSGNVFTNIDGAVIV
jgi:flagellar operon protein